jgi:hypothetical protein
MKLEPPPAPAFVPAPKQPPTQPESPRPIAKVDVRPEPPEVSLKPHRAARSPFFWFMCGAMSLMALTFLPAMLQSLLPRPLSEADKAVVEAERNLASVRADIAAAQPKEAMDRSLVSEAEGWLVEEPQFIWALCTGVSRELTDAGHPSNAREILQGMITVLKSLGIHKTKNISLQWCMDDYKAWRQKGPESGLPMSHQDVISKFVDEGWIIGCPIPEVAAKVYPRREIQDVSVGDTVYIHSLRGPWSRTTFYDESKPYEARIMNNTRAKVLVIQEDKSGRLKDRFFDLRLLDGPYRGKTYYCGPRGFDLSPQPE